MKTTAHYPRRCTGLLHWLEVAIRNAAHHALTAGYNAANWYDKARFPNTGRMRFTTLRGESRRGAGKVVAELTFGFWVELVSKPNQNVLWFGHGLRNAFPHTSTRRDQVHDRLKVIQRLRNRISHHERVLTSNNTLYAGFDFITRAQVVECVEWTCLETAQWMKAQHRFAEAGRILAKVNAMRIVL